MDSERKEVSCIIKLLKRLFVREPTQLASSQRASAVIIPRAEHAVSRANINPNALKVLYRLHQAGYMACLVGGCVRDLLLGKRPKDFDVVTSARPEEVRKLFRNCRLIGRRFRLAHIVYGSDIIEVATFRTHHDSASHDQGRTRQDGMILRDNVYGTIEDDVWRRDFTVNALYYNIADFTIIDYTGGMQDLAARQLRMIGPPEQRFVEDPVRLLRAIRFAGKLNFTIHADTEAHVGRLGHLLEDVSAARLFQEVLKFFQEGATLATFGLLEKYQLIHALFPQVVAGLSKPNVRQFMELALAGTDERARANKKVSPAFLLTALLWHPFLLATQHAHESGLPLYAASEKALKITLQAQLVRLAMPRRITLAIREIFMLQQAFRQRRGQRPWRVFEHPRFRAAFDLLLLRAQTGEDVGELADWWVKFESADQAGREKLLREVNHNKRPVKRRRFKSHKPKQSPPTFS